MSDYEYRQVAMQHFGVTQGNRMSLTQIKHWYNNRVKSDSQTTTDHIPLLTDIVEE